MICNAWRPGRIGKDWWLSVFYPDACSGCEYGKDRNSIQLHADACDVAQSARRKELGGLGWHLIENLVKRGEVAEERDVPRLCSGCKYRDFNGPEGQESGCIKGFRYSGTCEHGYPSALDEVEADGPG